RRNSAWRRETVTSSRKMSLSGWRPALVVSRANKNREPAFGPRLTTSRAEPAGNASIPETGASEAGASDWPSSRKSARKTEVRSGASSGGTPGPSFVVTWTLLTSLLNRLGRVCSTYRVRAGCGPSLPPNWTQPVGRSALDQLLIRLGVQQPVHRGRIGRGDLDQPALAVRVAVDHFRGVGHRVVDRGHLAVHRREQLRDALGRLDLAERLTRGDRGSRLREIDEHHIAQLILSVLGDTDTQRAFPRACRDPLVLLGVAQSVWNRHEPSLPAIPVRRRECAS